MDRPATIGNKIAPPRFLAFMAVLVAGCIVAKALLQSWTLGIMAGFDLAALVFLVMTINPPIR